MFFDGTDNVHKTMRRIADILEAASIPYAVAGGMAVNAHGYRRTTDDVDFLVTADGFNALIEVADSADIDRVPGRARRFVDRTTGVTFDVLVTGNYPGRGDPGPIAYPDPAAVAQIIENRPVLNLPTLVQLKLAAHRHKDFGDVVELIGVNKLDERFLEAIHPSVHSDYIECLEEKRREDEYEARQDEAAKRRERPPRSQPS